MEIRGNSTGPHLHFEIHYAPDGHLSWSDSSGNFYAGYYHGTRVNPLPYLNGEVKSGTSTPASKTDESGNVTKDFTSVISDCNQVTGSHVVGNGKRDWDKTSEQYQFWTNQKYGTISTDPTTNLALVDGKYYCLAMGTYFGKVGDKFEITMENGLVFNAIMCDAKGLDKEGPDKVKRVDGKSIGHYIPAGSGKVDLLEFYYYGIAVGGDKGQFTKVSKFNGPVKSIKKIG